MKYFELKYKELNRFFKIKDYFCSLVHCEYKNKCSQFKKQSCLEFFRMKALGSEDLNKVLKIERRS